MVTYATATVTPVKDVKLEDFWKALNEGGRWEDDPVQAPVHAAAMPRPEPQVAVPDAADLPLTVLVSDESRGVATPLMTKLYHESGLRQASNQALLHPDTARQYGIGEGDRALLQTHCGKCEVRVLFDPGTMPGIVHMVEGPVVMDICRGRSARAKVVRI